jgi:molybdopterin/thiamine biosynthesis adenylyltransferase
MNDCQSFYRLRNAKTSSYLNGRGVGSSSVHISIGAVDATTSAGQLALLALANQLCRVYRRMTFAVGDRDAPLMVPSRWPARNLAQSLLSMVGRIDPCGSFRIAEADENAVKIGIGLETGACDWYVGASQAIAELRAEPVPLDLTMAGTMRGAALATCLGAAAVMRTEMGLNVVPRRVSAWDYREGDAAAAGPADLAPVDVGRVLLVGAGAVGSALVYWLSMFGVRCDWFVVDGDEVAIHNLNRSLLFTAADSGWPSTRPRPKAEIVAAVIGGVPVPLWYDQAADLKELEFDVMLALANERDVRTAIAQRHAVVTLHATTGENWLSQLHRHIIGRDDCVRCRTADIRSAEFECSVAKVSSPDHMSPGDAALPFLSAASGLMLSTALQRLQSGDLGEGSINDWRWDFDSPHLFTSTSTRSCRDDCRVVPPPSVRKRINAGSRWSHLDPGCS